MQESEVENYGECMNMFCEHTNTKIYPAQFSNQTLYFCWKCAGLYEEKMCCYFCAQIYSDDKQSNLDGKDWI